MHILKLIGAGYVYGSLIVTLLIFLWFAWEDYQLYHDPIRRNNAKFGYNLLPNKGWSSVWGLGWPMTAALLPGVNLLVIGFIIFNWMDR